MERDYLLTEQIVEERRRIGLPIGGLNMNKSSTTNKSLKNISEPTLDNTTTDVTVISTATNSSVTELPWVSTTISSDDINNSTSICSEWQPAQHTLFQAANLFFALAFLVPRSFSQSILVVRTSLAVGFCLSAIWSGISVCKIDAVIWSTIIACINTIHAIRLAIRFLPPRLTPDLFELYDRVFGPLKVDKQHFKELTKQGRLIYLDPGETYAIEDITPTNERLSVLLSGKLRVSCDQTYLHSINPQQFIDSAEWEASRTGVNHSFQVTITAEETSVCLCWSKQKLELIFRMKPVLETIIITLIGKDITQKLYSMNEHLLTTAAGALLEQSATPKQQDEIIDHSVRWGVGSAGSEQSAHLQRSLSVDFVHTGTKGHVRSLAWRARQQQRALVDESTDADTTGVFPMHDSPVRKVTQFPASSPFVQFRKRQQSWVKPPPLIADTCFTYSPSALQGSSRGPSYFTYPQQLTASGLMVEPPVFTPSPIMAAMAASVGGLLRLPPHAPALLEAQENNKESSPPVRKEVTFDEDIV